MWNLLKYEITVGFSNRHQSYVIFIDTGKCSNIYVIKMNPTQGYTFNKNRLNKL